MAIERVYLEIRLLRSKTNPEDISLVIENQPFIERAFNENSSEFVASNGFTLASQSCPEIGGDRFLYVRGDNEDRDFLVIQVYEDYLRAGFIDALRVAVSEYNARLDERYDRLEGRIQPAPSVPIESLMDEHIVPNKKTVRILV